MFARSSSLLQNNREEKSSKKSLLKAGFLAVGALVGCYATYSYLGQPADVPKAPAGQLTMLAEEYDVDPRRMFNTEESEWCFEDLRNYKDEFDTKRDIFGTIIKWKSKDTYFKY